MKNWRSCLAIVAVLVIAGPGLQPVRARGGFRRGGGGPPSVSRPAASRPSAPAVTTPRPSAPTAVTSAASGAVRPGASQPSNVWQPSPGQPTNVYRPSPGTPTNVWQPSPGQPTNVYRPSPGTPTNVWQPSPGQPTNVYRPSPGTPTNVWQPSPGTPTNVYRPTPGGPGNVYQPVPGSARSIPPGTGIINVPGLANQPGGVVHFPSTPNIDRPISVVQPAGGGRPGPPGPVPRPPIHYPPWYHGNWHNGWNNNTARNAALLAAGGALAYYPGYYWWYDSGYGYYENPYYEKPEDQTTEAAAPDYSQPVINSETAATAAVSQEGMALLDHARGAFLHGDYDQALALANQAAAVAPNDPMVHEFRSLALFALGKYSEAAAAIHSVLAVKPGWDWTTLLGLYPDQAAYREQLAALEKHCAEHPQESASRFLLAYHQLTAGKIPEAQESLKKVVELTPQDPIAASLLKLTSGAPPATAAGTAPPAGAPAAAALPRWDSQPDLKGAWKAEGRNSTSIQLLLDDKGDFAWAVSGPGGHREFAGTYSYSTERLVLTRQGAGPVAGAIAPAPEGGFRFRPDSVPPTDPGIVFTR